MVLEGRINAFLTLLGTSYYWREIAYSPPVLREIPLSETHFIPRHFHSWFISLRRFEEIPHPYLHFEISTRVIKKDLLSSGNPNAIYLQGIDLFLWRDPEPDRRLIHQSALMGHPRGIYMDLMLRVVERVGLLEVPKALEALQVRLGSVFTQFVRTRVIYDVRWHEECMTLRISCFISMSFCHVLVLVGSSRMAEVGCVTNLSDMGGIFLLLRYLFLCNTPKKKKIETVH